MRKTTKKRVQALSYPDRNSNPESLEYIEASKLFDVDVRQNGDTNYCGM
jgi:hypothetical protein